MNRTPHVWLIHFYSPQHEDGSFFKGTATITSTKTGLPLLNEADERLKSLYPEQEKLYIACMSNLGESD